ncbi:MAG: hypothetical protein IJI58_03390 [Bacilli bacterium]|nr:hypothetical protein [Bacilli bacterium]
MNNRILFMIIDDQVKYLTDGTMDHREWYNSLGLDPNNYENIVRGFIIDGKIIFFKGSNFISDNEVMNAAKRHAPGIRLYLNNNYEVYCGIEAHSLGGKWEPIVKINDNELTGIVQKKEEPKKEVVPKETGPALEFKNDYNDPKFVKRAILVTIGVLILSLAISIIGFIINDGELDFLDFIFTIGEVALLVITIIGYKKKKETVKASGILAAALLVFTFNIFNIILGIFYFVFSVDQNYILKIIELIKGLMKGKKGE